MKNKMNVYYRKGEVEVIDDGSICSIDAKGNAVVRRPCPRCEGKGEINYYKHVQAGICFKCEGNRYMYKNMKLRTMEEALKLVEKYKAKKEKERLEYLAQRRREFIEKYEALTDMYVVYKDSYEIKDYLKELGYKFSNALKMWYGAVKPDKGTYVFIAKEDFFNIEEDCNEISINYANINKIIGDATLANTEFFGEVDKKYNITLKVLNIKILDGKYTTHLVTLTDGIHKFNCFTNAYKVLDNIDIDGEYNFVVTIKKHDTYNNEKITYLKGIKLA